MIPQIGTRTQLFGVLGCPVGHSLSPAMHNAALWEMGIDGVYLAFEVAPEQLGAAILGLEALGAVGVNCTIPHKVAVMDWIDELTEEARTIGAVNTVSFRNGRKVGHNTDGQGFLAALRAAGAEPTGHRVVILGAGGSARAVVSALSGTGAELVLANRTPDKAEGLARLAAEAGVRAEVIPLEPDALKNAVRSADILVNTTSLGMSPRTEAAPPVPESAFHPDLFVYDLVYNPLETRLLRTARTRGSRGCHGAGMLAHQGALALREWTGRTAPVEKMEQVVMASLQGIGDPAAN